MVGLSVLPSINLLERSLRVEIQNNNKSLNFNGSELE